MVYPFNTNMIEQLAIDPIKKVNGMVWFNTTDKVYKAAIDDEFHVLLTDKSFVTQVDALVAGAFTNTQFTIDFDSASVIIVKHNKNSVHFNYNMVDTNTNETINTSLEIIDENEVRIDLVDPVTGSLFMYFG